MFLKISYSKAMSCFSLIKNEGRRTGKTIWMRFTPLSMPSRKPYAGHLPLKGRISGTFGVLTPSAGQRTCATMASPPNGGERAEYFYFFDQKKGLSPS